MKTPEEIKKGLECCNNMADGCMECPYETEGESGWHCVVERNIDALAYIQQLERERDAAIADVKSLCATNYFSGNFCEYCKHNEPDGQCHHHCISYSSEWGWEWRGVREVEET